MRKYTIYGIVPLLIVGRPADGLAIPTPDTLIAVGSYLPYVLTGVISLIAAAALIARRYIKKHVTRALVVSVIATALMCSSATLYLSYRQRKIAERDDIFRLYYRGDLSLDLLQVRAAAQFDKWLSVLKPIYSLKSVKRLVEAEKIELVALDRSRLSYDSGMPTLEFGGKRRIFRFLWYSELDDFLKRISSSREASKTVVLFVNGTAFQSYFPFNEYPEIAAKLKKLKGAYFLVWSLYNAGMNFSVKDAETGELRAANRHSHKTNFPVRKEAWLIDDSAIVFPNIDKILSIKDCASLVQQNATQLVVPFNSQYRPPNTLQLYLEQYFAPIWNKNFPSRVHYIDFNSVNIDNNLQKLTKELGNQPFLVLALTKHDWIYLGLNVPAQMAKVLEQSKGEMQYLGGCPWMAEIGYELARH